MFRLFAAPQITGLVCAQLYGVVAGLPVEKLRDVFLNTAINLYSMSEPMPPSKTVSQVCSRALRAPC